MAGSNTVQRRVASALARCITMSALRSSSPAWSLPGWLRAMPTLAPTDTSPEDRRTGSASASSIRPAKVEGLVLELGDPGRPGWRVVEGLVHGVDGAGVLQGQAGLLGEGQQHLLLDPAVGPPGVIGATTRLPTAAPVSWTGRPWPP